MTFLPCPGWANLTEKNQSFYESFLRNIVHLPNNVVIGIESKNITKFVTISLMEKS